MSTTPVTSSWGAAIDQLRALGTVGGTNNADLALNLAGTFSRFLKLGSAGGKLVFVAGSGAKKGEYLIISFTGSDMYDFILVSDGAAVRMDRCGSAISLAVASAFCNHLLDLTKVGAQVSGDGDQGVAVDDDGAGSGGVYDDVGSSSSAGGSTVDSGGWTLV
jgi:hypothetical protein